MRLLGRVGRGVAWMAGGEAARRATGLIVGIVLVRLLTPADYGMFAMAMFVTGFIELFGRLGLTEALIQGEKVTEDDWSTAYWIGIGMGVLVGVLAWGLGPIAGAFYHDERVIPIVRGAGWGALVLSIGATQAAWLAKHMQFRAIALAEWTGVLAGGGVGVALALTGWGVWSLVLQTLFATAITGLLLHFHCPWRPVFRVRLSRLSWAVRFGLGLQGFGIVNYFYRRLDDAIIGRYLGPVELGYYSRAYDLMVYPVNSVAGIAGRVIFPALSSIGDDLPRFRAAYLRAVMGIAIATFPAMLVLLVMAPEVIAVVFGPQWMPTVPLVRVLSIIGLFQSVLTTNGWIFLARGRTDVMLKWGLAAAVVFCSSFVIGVQWGTMGVAVAYAIANLLLLYPSLAIPLRLIRLPFADVVRSLRGVFIGAVLTAMAVAVVRASLLAATSNLPIVLSGSVTIGVLIYVAWLWLAENDTAREARLIWSQVTRGFEGSGQSGIEVEEDFAVDRQAPENHRRKSLVSRPERPAVAHFVFPYLFGTGSWIHGQLVHMRRYRPIVLTDRTENLDMFPFQAIHTYEQVSLLQKALLCLSNPRLHGVSWLFFERIVRQERPCLLHGHFGTSAVEMLDLKRRLDLPMVTAFYGADVSQAPRNPRWQRRYERLFNEGELFLAQGSAMRRTLIALGCPSGKVVVQHLGVDLQALPFVVRRPDRSGIVRILVAATFREKKGIPYALRAIDRVRRRYPQLAVTLIGDSAGKATDEDEKRKIISILAELEGTVTWLGFVPHPAFRAAVLSHHLFLSPSVTAGDGDSEGGAPVTIIEAQATGMPILSTLHADIPEVVVDGKSGLLSHERDVDSLAENLERLVAGTDLWESMGRYGRRHVEENFDVRRQVARLEEIYSEVVGLRVKQDPLRCVH